MKNRIYIYLQKIYLASYIFLVFANTLGMLNAPGFIGSKGIYGAVSSWVGDRLETLVCY